MRPAFAPRLTTPRIAGLNIAGLVASLTLLAAAPSLAAGTDAEREACMGDAFKLCSTAMPDEKRVENCLRAAGPRLSRACYDVFNPQQASNQTPLTRGQGRMQPSAPQRIDTPSMPQSPPRTPDDD